MVGFHWTKVHDESTGEVYVVGHRPDGAAATGWARRSPSSVCIISTTAVWTRVILYVDESNLSAVRLYRGLGFERIGLDVMYARPPTTTAGGFPASPES